MVIKIKRILIIRSANLNIMNKLIKLINDKFINEKVKIYCLTNRLGYESLSKEHGNIEFLLYDYKIFRYKILKKDKKLIRNINKNIYDEVYIPSSYSDFHEMDNVLQIASKIKSKKYILFNCNSQLKEIKLKYCFLKIAEVAKDLNKSLIKVMLYTTEKYYLIIKKIYNKRILETILKKHERMDRGKRFIRDIILFNNRFDYYKAYLELAKVNGYVITSLADYINNYMQSDKKVVILRHDIDSITNNTKEMFMIEQSKKVLSTYYFRWITFDKELISIMNNNNFEVGLHYETLADYCEKNNISVVNQKIIEICRSILKEEIIKFNEKNNLKIQTIASHGHPYNIKLKVSNNILLEDIKYEHFGIKLEAYDKNLYQNYIVTHIMDSNVMNNYGFSYETNPIQSIKMGDKVIMFLAHPEHWKYSINDRMKMYLDYKKGNYINRTNRKFIRINRDVFI